MISSIWLPLQQLYTQHRLWPVATSGCYVTPSHRAAVLCCSCSCSWCRLWWNMGKGRGVAAYGPWSLPPCPCLLRLNISVLSSSSKLRLTASILQHLTYVPPSTIYSIQWSLIGWRYLYEDENGLKWMKIDEMDEVEESGWKWLKMDESGWKWMQVVESGWKWMKIYEMDESGWKLSERV